MRYIESFKKFVIEYEPFEWEKQDKSLYDNKTFVHSLETGFKRFFKVYLYLKKTELLVKTKKRIVDVGAYPGNMLRLCQHIFGKDISYFAVGLGFSKSYKKTMTKLNANTIETELDPTFPYAKRVNKWKTKDNNICLLLDVIEHLVNPVHCLDEINKSLKKGGYLILTTDNITNFRYVINMFISGKSPNIHPLRSSLIYTGDWRPHFREYSKDELFFLLEYCGYKIVKHEYFDREMGTYFINKKKNKINKVYNFKKLRNFLSFLTIKITNLIPHLRSHHIILAQKKIDNSKLEKNRIKTDDKLVWFKIRKKYNLD